MDDDLDSQLEGGTERSLRTLGVSEWEAGNQTGNPATQVGLCRALGIQVCWRCWVGCTKLVPSEDRAATAAIEWTVAGGEAVCCRHDYEVGVPGPLYLQALACAGW